MTPDAITEAIHEHNHIQQNQSDDTEYEKKIRYVREKNKRKYDKETNERPKKFQNWDCMRRGAPIWTEEHESPARGKKCAKCGKPRHFARVCRSQKQSTTYTRMRQSIARKKIVGYRRAYT